MLFHDVDALARTHSLPRGRVKDAIEDEFRRVQLRSPLAWLLLIGAALTLGLSLFGALENGNWPGASLGLVAMWTMHGAWRSRAAVAARLQREGASR